MTHLVMHQYVHDIVVDFRGDPSFRFVGEQDILNPKKRYQDESSSHRLHVETGLSLVGHLQLGDEDSHNVQQKEQIHLKREEQMKSASYSGIWT